MCFCVSPAGPWWTRRVEHARHHVQLARVAAQLAIPRNVLRPDVARIGCEHGALSDLLLGLARHRRRSSRERPHGPRSGSDVPALHRAEPSRDDDHAAGRRRVALAGARGRKWVRTYHAAAATPLEPRDILYGKLSWVATRAFATGIVYTIVIGAFGALESWWSLTLPFIGALIALAFSAPLVAFAARSQSDASFATIYRFAFVPMFLFSATFYPITAYPRDLRPLVQLVPLYHGVALARAAAFGHGSAPALAGHLAYLIVMAGVGVAWGRHTMRRRLVD